MDDKKGYYEDCLNIKYVLDLGGTSSRNRESGNYIWHKNLGPCNPIIKVSAMNSELIRALYE